MIDKFAKFVNKDVNIQISKYTIFKQKIVNPSVKGSNTYHSTSF